MSKNEFRTVRGYQLLEKDENRITSAMEDYIEMIRRKSDENGYMRVSKLAEFLHVKASSATKMVQRLGDLGFMKYERYGVLVLTKKGIELGDYLLKRHRILEEFLETIGIDNSVLEEIELVEHSISTKTLLSIDVLNNFFKNTPDAFDSYIKYRTIQINKND